MYFSNQNQSSYAYFYNSPTGNTPRPYVQRCANLINALNALQIRV